MKKQTVRGSLRRWTVPLNGSVFLGVALLFPRFVTGQADSFGYIRASELIDAQRSEAGWTIVDVRDEAAFAAHHIPGSLLLPLYALKTKAFLKTKPLVVVDGGWGSPVTTRALERLEAFSFTSVRLLHGGLVAWHGAGGVLQGTGDPSENPAHLRASEVAAIPSFDDWLVVDVEAGEVEPSLGAISLPFVPEDPGAFRSMLHARKVERGTRTRVLVMNGDGDGYAAIAAALKGSDVYPVFYLEGGRKALEEERSRNEAMRNATSVRTSAPSRAGRGNGPRPCATCPGAAR